MTEKQSNDMEENLKELQSRIASAACKAGRDPSEIKLMAVTKTVDPQLVNLAVRHGVTLLGENRAQELLEKVDHYLLGEAEIHFIGTLQSNKVRQIIDYVSLIQSVDRFSIAKEIQRQAAQRDRVMDILIQINVGREPSKSGIDPAEALAFTAQIQEFTHLNLRGIMAIPPICEENEELCNYFAILRQLLVDIQAQNRDNRTIDILSMGMSGDFEMAIEYGATLVRVGTALFGARDNINRR